MLNAMLHPQDTKPFSLIHHLADLYIGENTSTVFQIYSALTDLLISIVVTATIYQLLLTPSQQDETLTVSLVVCIAYSLAIYYSLCFRMQYHKISLLFTLLDETRLSLSKIVDKTSVYQYFHSDLKHNKMYIYFGSFTALMSAFLFSVQPLLRSAAVFGMDGSKRLQIDIWCPFNLQVPCVFEIIVIIQFFTVFWVALRFFANDSFYMLLIKVNIRFFKHLTTFGEDLLKPTMKHETLVEKSNRIRKANFDSLKLRQIQPTLQNIEENLDIRMSLYEDFPLTFDEDFNKQAEEKLSQFITNHQLILRCSQLTCELYGPVLLMYFLSLMGFASVGAFGVLHTNGFEGVQSIAVSFFSIANLLGMYVTCEAGDDLAQKSSDVTESMGGSPWYVCSKKFHSSLVVVFQRVNTRVQACVIGVPSMPLSCSTFAWVIKTLVSLYLFLVQVQGVKKV